MTNDVESLNTELQRVRAERDRLFALAVQDDENKERPFGWFLTDSIVRVLGRMTAGDLPNRELVKALREHDRRARTFLAGSQSDRPAASAECPNTTLLTTTRLL
jgi:hypothetical protein